MLLQTFSVFASQPEVCALNIKMVKPVFSLAKPILNKVMLHLLWLNQL